MKKFLSLLITVSLILSSFSVVFAAGDSEADPILIATADELIAAAQEINRSGNGGDGKYYKLTENIDLDGISWYDSIGTTDIPFVGTFDGNGKIVSNYKIPVNSTQSYVGVGLFGTVGGNAVIKNIGVEKVEVFGDDTYGWDSYVGALAGYVVGNATISGSFARKVTFDTKPGGTGVQVGSAGGLLGRVNGSGVTVKDCYSVDFTEKEDCCASEGGLMGMIVDFAAIENCYSSKTLAVYGSADQVKKVTNSYCTEYDWYENIGQAAGTRITADELKLKYTALGSAFVKGYAAYGGFPALAWEEAPEAITGEGTKESPYMVSSAQHLVEIASATDTDGVYYKLKNDINMENAVFSNHIGTVANPFKGVFDGDGHIIKNFKLVIPATASDYSDAAALFGCISGNAEIKNLGVENVDVSSTANSWHEVSAGIVGLADGNSKVSGCYVKNLTLSDITTPELLAFGGIVGASLGDGVVVENCYSIGLNILDATADNDAGIVGFGKEFSKIENCYSTYTIVRTPNEYKDKVINSYYSGAAPWPWDGADFTQCYAGTQVTASELKGMASTLGSAFKTGSFETGGMPALAWQPDVESSGGTGTADDPMLIKTAQDLVSMASIENTSGMYFELENDIDLGDAEWTSAIGSKTVPFKGYFNGNGHVIKNYKLAITGNDIVGLFGVVGGDAYLYDFGVENVKCVLSNASSWDSTCGGIVGLMQDNAIMTGCYAKDVDFSLTFVRDWEGEVKYGGALIGKINGAGVEIRNCYSKGFTETYSSGTPPVNNEGGFAGEGTNFAVVSNCYSDTTMFRATGWLTNENCYQGQSPREWPAGYEWDADTVDDITDLAHKLGKEFVNVEGEGPALRWEMGSGKYLNLVDGGSFSNANPADFGSSLSIVTGRNGRISKMLKVPAGKIVTTTVSLEADKYYRVSVRTTAEADGTFTLGLGDLDITEYLADNNIGNAWKTQATIIKTTDAGDAVFTFAADVDTYIDDIEIFEIDTAVEESVIKASIRANYQKNSYVDDKVAVEFMVNDGMKVSYQSENGYIDGDGYLTETVPLGFGTVTEKYIGTVSYADQTVTNSFDVTLKQREPYDILSVELLDSDNNRVYGMAKAVKIGNANIDINTEKQAKIVTALYKDGMMTAVKITSIDESGVCAIDMNVADSDAYKMFVVTENSVEPLAIPNQSYKTLKDVDTVTIRTIGDSLAATYDLSAILRGWGQVIEDKYSDNVTVDNSLSLGGMTAHNFLFNGRFDTLLANMNEGDYVYIQLATNDRVQGFTLDEFKLFLTQFVQMIRDNGGYPVFVTSPEESDAATNNVGVDGKYIVNSVHGGYPDVMRTIGVERDVPVIDLNAETQRLMAEVGYDGIMALNYWTEDTIHFNEAGANYLADFIATESANIGLPIGEFVISE